MKQTGRKSNAKTMARACYMTALLNSLLPAGYAQDAITGQSEGPGLAEKIFSYGPFDVRPHASGRVFYDDNIFISPQKRSDVVWTLSPGVLIGAGDYLEKEENLFTLAYTPTAIIFTEHSSESAIDHEAHLVAQGRSGSWTLGLQQDVQVYSGAVVDVGDRVDRRIYNTALVTQYEISPKTSIELNGRQSINDYDDAADFNEWVVAGWLDYWVTPKVKVGVGITAGFLDIDSSVNQTYQQALVRAAYSLSDKLELRASAGGQLRQFQEGQSERANGIFSLGATYKPVEKINLTLEAYRRDQNSIVLADQNYTTTGFNGRIRYALDERVALQVGAGYDNLDYNSNRSGISATRNDDYYYVQLGADWTIGDRLVLTAFYQHRESNSSDSNFNFDNNQVGLSVAYGF